MNRELLPHQARGLEQLRNSIATGHKRPMLQSPTGSGKTILAAAIIERALGKGNRVIMTVPRLSLVDQTIERLYEEGIRDVGVMQGSHAMTNGSRPVQVATLQTLARREVPPAGLVLVDEAHESHDFARHWMADQAWAKVPFIGLSATPWTKGLGKFFDDLIVPTTTDELIKAGLLSPFKVFAPGGKLDLSGVKTVAGDYHVGQLSEKMSKPTITGDVVQTWLERGEDRPTLCYAVDLAHARALQKQFEGAGVQCGYVDGTMDRKERQVVADRFHNRLDQVVVSVGTLTTGIDWDVRCLILARPTKSEILYTQIIGRGLRTATGKSFCLILDHSDTTARLGFVTDIHHTVLDDGRPREKVDVEKRLPKLCPKCHCMRSPNMHECPNCGFAPERRCNVVNQQGELQEITAAKVQASRETKQRWYSSLLHICNERGYKPGWAAQQFRKKFGVWPRMLDERPIPPPPDITSWVRSRQIAYAKRKAANGGGSHVSA